MPNAPSLDSLIGLPNSLEKGKGRESDPSSNGDGSGNGSENSNGTVMDQMMSMASSGQPGVSSLATVIGYGKVSGDAEMGDGVPAEGRKAT